MIDQRSVDLRSEGDRTIRRLEWILGVAGASLLIAAALATGHRSHAARAALDEFSELKERQLVVSGSIASKSAPVPFPNLDELANARSDQTLWSEQAKTHWQTSLSGQVAPPIAALEIPRLSMRFAVLGNVDAVSLHRSVGWIPGTAPPGEEGNTAIAGHRDSHFRGLKDIRLGDRIILESLGGSTTFEVSELRIVSPEENGVLANDGRHRLTLVTCYPFYYVGSAPERWIVTAEPVDTGGDIASP